MQLTFHQVEETRILLGRYFPKTRLVPTSSLPQGGTEQTLPPILRADWKSFRRTPPTLLEYFGTRMSFLIDLGRNDGASDGRKRRHPFQDCALWLPQVEDRIENTWPESFV